MSVPKPLVPDSLVVLQPLVEAGVLSGAEMVVCDAVTRLSPEPVDDAVIQGIALAALGRRLGHSCVDLDRAAELYAAAAPGEELPEGTLPEYRAWVDALGNSSLVQVGEATEATWDRPLVFAPDMARVWLGRYALYERTLCALLLERAGRTGNFDDVDIRKAVNSAFGDGTSVEDVRQREAVLNALRRPLSFITGGPGTGKTWTVGRLLEAVRTLDSHGGGSLAVALAAPTGKAAERLTETVGGDVGATTVHALLGLYPGMAVGVEPPRKLPHDLIVIDEASMIDLAMMVRLLGAVRDEAHVVFVGDPDQLLSVEVGSVLRDVVDAAADDAAGVPAGSVTHLRRVHRFGGRIGELAEAVGRGDADTVLEHLAESTRPEIDLVEPADTPAMAALHARVVDATRPMVDTARDGDPVAALANARACKVLTATRAGPWGLGWWNRRLSGAFGFDSGDWSPGRPVIVTRNDRANGVFNGDTGVVVPEEGEGDAVRVVFSGPDGPRSVTPTRLRDQEDWWAMTIHKSQGSEFDHVVVSLPREGSPILSRELLYTAVTRARERVTILASPDVVRAATERRVDRASGVRERLVGH